VTAARKPTAGSTDAAFRAESTDDDPIASLGGLIRLKPLDTGSQGEY